MSWYNLSGTVVEIKGLQDTYFHDVLRIPNWPTQAAARAHHYSLNAAQDSAVIAAGIQVDTAGGGAAASPVTGGPGATDQAAATGAASSNLAHDLAPSFSLIGRGFAGWFKRALQLTFGAVLIIIGIAKLTGTMNRIETVAGKVGAGAIVGAM